MQRAVSRDNLAIVVEVQVPVVTGDCRDRLALNDLDLEAIRQAAPHDGRLDAQVVHEVLRHDIRLQLEERLARVDAPDLKDLLPCQIRYTADFHALQREDRRVDHDGHDEAAGRQEQESLKKPPAAAMFFLLLLLQSLSPCTKKRRTMPESGAANQ